MKEIYVVTTGFSPRHKARTIQTQRLIKALMIEYKVTLICADASYAKELLGEQCKVICFRLFGGEFLLKFDQYIFPIVGFLWSITAYLKLRKMSGVTLILTLSSPISAHFLGYLLKKKKRNRWISFFSDPWPFSILPTPYRRNIPFFSHIHEYIAKKIIDKSDQVLFTNPYAARYIEIKLNLDLSRKNGVLPHLYEESEASNECFSEKENSQKVITHAGNLTRERISEPFFSALFSSCKKFNVTVNFLGETDPKLGPLIPKDFPKDLISFSKHVQGNELSGELKSSKSFLILESCMELSPFIPSKVTDIIEHRLPALVLTNKKSPLSLLFYGNPALTFVFYEDTLDVLREKIELHLISLSLKQEVNVESMKEYYNNHTVLRLLKSDVPS